MQPFDGGKFDKRYEDVFSPAIKSAGLEPYRVDKDPGVEIPINDIEKGIREASVCLADITTDNPNVWFELGYAISANKPVVLVCSRERTGKFPFDVQHRTIISYDSESRSDFDALEIKIKDKILASLEKAETLNAISSNQDLAPIEGLSQQELIVIASLAANVDSPNHIVVVDTIRNDVTRSGFTRIAFSLGLKALTEKGLVKYERVDDFNAGEWWGYMLTKEGWTWLLKNQAKFAVRATPPKEDNTDVPF